MQLNFNASDPTHVIGLYPHLLPSKQRNSLTFPADTPRLEGVDYEKALIALIDYLNEVSLVIFLPLIHLIMKLIHSGSICENN